MPKRIAIAYLLTFTEREQAIRAGTLIHQPLNIMANDCDLSDKLFHAHHSDGCAQSDKLNNTNH